ncbi:MAG TPA: carbohydrate kinase, partial [Anaerolineaceae bacterium]|nr:carbohydrate kinase [Anaerolineaceae bacterium]
MVDSYLLGVDIGTYSSKGVLVTLDGRVVASHVVPHDMSMPKPGHFEHDADGIWWHDFVFITQKILDETGIDPHQILSVGTSAIGSCVLPIDEEGKPLRPGILYGIDTRAMDEINQLKEIAESENIAALKDATLTSQTSGPKILWIRNKEPEIYARTRWFLTSQAYIVYKLTGVPSIDVYTAGGYAPMFDSVSLSWVKEMENYITEVDR